MGNRRLGAVAAAVATGALVLSACTSTQHSAQSGAPATPVARGGGLFGGGGATSSSASAKPAAPKVVPLAKLTSSVRNGARNVNPTSPITVTAANGTLSSVKITASDGKAVKSTLSADKTSWRVATDALAYSHSYTVVAKAVNPDGKPTVKTEKFTTLTPANMTMPTIDSLGGYGLPTGGTFGVGIVPIVHFDEPITDKAAAQRALTVTTTPKVNGVWYWADDQDVHYRPQSFWPSGTKVTITADLYGVQVGKGLYGQADAKTSFTIGRKQVTIADDSAPKVDKVRVYNAAGKVLRTMNTSMGEHSGEQVGGNWINFYTPGGTYTVLDHENPAIMSSASYGLPADAPGGYAPEAIPYSTRISIDGIYLHELDTTVWAQDNGDDVSHGCLNLDRDNAIWFFDHSIPGDPVVINGTKGAPKVQEWEGGDWSVPWSTWVAGSAVKG